MKLVLPLKPRLHFAALLILVASLAGGERLQAQPTIISSVPANNATGVSPSAAVVFTFSLPMDTSATSANFLNTTNPTFYNTTAAWSLNDTVLTCTPVPPFPTNTSITWVVGGQDTNGNSLSGLPFGTFTTVGAGGGGGTGTNKVSLYTVGKIHYYDQTSTNAPSLDPITPYGFAGSALISSNLTVSSVNLMLPTSVQTNLFPIPGHPESNTLVLFMTNLTAFDTNFPAGNYTFSVQPSNSQVVAVNLSAALVQPPIPYVTDYPQAQSVDPTQPFQLTWSPFSGSAPPDFIQVNIGGAFVTGSPLVPNSLSNTAVSVTIPANTLAPNTSYLSYLGFYHAVQNTNNAAYYTQAYLVTATQFSLLTTSGGAVTNPLILTNFALSNRLFSFDIKSATGLALVVQYNASVTTTNWTNLLTTNSPTGTVRITDPQLATNHSRYYRAKVGP